MTAMSIPSAMGVGPVTKNTIDACINFANRHDYPLMLIASRRQIENSLLGGGYVEGWTPETLAKYVSARAPGGSIVLCRDHGGPWQHPKERELGLTESAAMASCLESFKSDIRAGFSVLHIDTCMDADGLADRQVAVDRLLELYRECHAFAQSVKRSIKFEIGFEDQSVDTNDPGGFLEETKAIVARLEEEGLPLPTFVVAQTGMKVVETVNTGALTIAPEAVGYTIRSLSRTCRKLGIALKAHNADYLSESTLRKLRACGVAAVNVAPEFATTETRALLQLLDRLGLGVQRERFLALAYESKKWEKWLKSDSRASNYERAVIAGHYVFGTDEFKELKTVANDACVRRGEDLDSLLQAAIEDRIEHYVRAFCRRGASPEHPFEPDQVARSLVTSAA